MFSLAQRGYGVALQLVSAVVLARLLDPAETGIFALAAALVVIAQMLRDFGVGEYIIAQAEVTLEKMRAAFTLTLLIAIAIACVLFLLAGPLASFYREPGVELLLQVLSVNFLLLPFGSVAFALLSKDLQFERIFWIQSFANTLGTVVTLALAWHGASYMSMAYGGIVCTATTVLTVLVFHGQSFFFLPTFRGLRQVAHFGGILTFARFLEMAAFRSNDIVVSSLLGFHAGGILSKTNSLISSFHDVFNSAVVRVAMPAFAQSREHVEQTRAKYQHATTLVFSAQWLFFPALAVFAHELVLILFGRNWLECVLLVQIGAVSSLMWAPYMLSVPLLTAVGAVRDLLRMQLIWAPLLALSFLVGAHFGLVWVVVLSSLTVPVRLYLLDRALSRHCGIRFKETVLRLVPSIQVSATAVVCAVLARQMLLAMNAPMAVVLLVGLAVMAVTALGAARLIRHPLLDELQRVRLAMAARL